MGKIFRSAIYWVGYAIFLMLLAEGFLYGVAQISRPVDRLLANGFGAPRAVDDPLLGKRLNPEFAEHDDWGFRNALIGDFGLRSSAVPEQVEIVAIGDSQTYGVNAPAEDAWPHQLARELSAKVYNMGVGGTGPARYLHNLDLALQLDPQLIIVAFYFGNDFWDVAEFVYHREKVPDELTAWREAYLAANPHYVEFLDVIYPEVIELNVEVAKILEPGFTDARPVEGEVRVASTWEERGSARQWLSDNSKLYGFGRLVKSSLTNPSVRHGRPEARAEADPAFWEELCGFADRTEGVHCHERGDYRTVLDARLRVKPEMIIEAGMEIAIDVFQRFRDRLAGSKTSLMVALIPAKEFIYLTALPEELMGIDPMFEQLFVQEAKTRAKIIDSLSELGIDHVDLLPRLVDSARANEPIYPASSQSHPRAHGYGVIARAIADHVVSQGITPR